MFSRNGVSLARSSKFCLACRKRWWISPRSCIWPIESSWSVESKAENKTADSWLILLLYPTQVFRSNSSLSIRTIWDLPSDLLSCKGKINLLRYNGDVFKSISAILAIYPCQTFVIFGKDTWKVNIFSCPEIISDSPNLCRFGLP